MKGLLDQDHLEHFLLLHCAVALLAEPSLTPENAECARQCIRRFIQQYTPLYFPYPITFNLHALSHLPSDALRYGGLDKISCFPFENFLKSLKGLVRGARAPLAQVVRRMAELNKLPSYRMVDDRSPITPSEVHRDGPLPQGYPNGVKQYGKIILETEKGEITIKSKEPDNCVQLEENICKVVNIIEYEKSIHFVVRIYQPHGDFYTEPFQSSLVGEIICVDTNDPLKCFPLSSLIKKIVLLSYEETLLAIPMRHLS